MNILNSLRNLFIDFSTQGAFLAGEVPSIDCGEMVLPTVHSGYKQLEIIFFDFFTISENDVIVDVGCGKGRVFNYLLYKGLKNKMIGYEINELLAKKTKKNLSTYENIEIRGENILTDFPEQGNIFYLFNPFKERMTMEFRDEILKRKDRNPVILYYNPEQIHLFDNENFECVVRDIPIRQHRNFYQLAIIKTKTR
jgi:hypothetical protein